MENNNTYVHQFHITSPSITGNAFLLPKINPVFTHLSNNKKYTKNPTLLFLALKGGCNSSFFFKKSLPSYIIKHQLMSPLSIGTPCYHPPIAPKAATAALYFAKYYYIGLGYKMFKYQSKLFVWVGLTHYTTLNIPRTIRITCKKKRIYLIGSDENEFNSFMLRIRRIRHLDIYKGKGILEVKTYKGFIRMKTGKKKQYM